MRFGSLFTGIGGLDLGLERAGMTCAWQVEINPFCQDVLRKHWPDVPKHWDIRELRGSDVEQVDCIAGGFPCQDVSQAGKRSEGIEGPRSGLWREFARLVREIRPRFVIVENVPGLASRGLGTVLGDLAACGFDAEWGVLSAKDCGAPHLRRRLFVLAARRPVPHTFGDVLRELGQREREQHTIQGSALVGDHGEVLADGHGRGSLEVGDAGGQSEHQGTSRDQSHGRRRAVWPPAPDDMHAWRTVPADSQPALCGVVDGLSEGVDRDLIEAMAGRTLRLAALGNAVVPAQAFEIGRRLMVCLEESKL